MGGKTLLRVNGSAIGSPSRMLVRAFRTACSTTLLPAVLATISSAVKIGTPERTRVERVRAKRAMATFRNNVPRMGMRSFQ